MGEFITTYTGQHFEPTNPNPELIRIEDIAHALSMICRGNGHVKTFGRWDSIVFAVLGRQQPVVCQIEWYLHACFMMQVNAICPMFQHHLRMNYRNIRSRKNICLA